MKIKSSLMLLALFLLLALVIPVVLFLPKQREVKDSPSKYLPEKLPHTDHTALMKGPYETGSSVTEACLVCHENAASEVMKGVHWTWLGEPFEVDGRDQPVRLGKRNAINNFCIGISSNWPACTACHAGYGWEDENFDFSNQKNVDCLVCHDHSGQYVKTKAGFPAEGVDLAAAAQSVGTPKRENCGGCHFRGGGGNAVKHGDLDESLTYPSEEIDVHMGKHDFVCTDCHQTLHHEIKGRAISVSYNDVHQVYCTDCHAENLHDDERINNHVQSVACQTCHIPHAAVREATKMHWDWAQAGKDIPEDPHEYLKIKGRFIYEKNITPEYFWFDGTATHYLFGDKIDPNEVTLLNEPNGSYKDAHSKIWPFKVHTATQIYDTEYNTLIQPKTYGEGGYWTEFDWDKAARLGSEAIGQPYSGHYGFTRTAMFWTQSHMVAPKEKALQCIDCHNSEGTSRMNWQALGYDGDPIIHGGRNINK